jgi:hypothetical protein
MKSPSRQRLVAVVSAALAAVMVAAGCGSWIAIHPESHLTRTCGANGVLNITITIRNPDRQRAIDVSLDYNDEGDAAQELARFRSLAPHATSTPVIDAIPPGSRERMYSTYVHDGFHDTGAVVDYLSRPIANHCGHH